ncbi:MAG: hypothetical protein JNJ52_12465 [Flavobacterium sp.]|nr:hypothetical protein [Flavobacterium sp.]
MKNVYIFCLFLINWLYANAQSDIEKRNALQSMGSLSTSGAWIPAKSNQTVILGSVYLFPNWVGQYKVIDNTGTTTNLFNLNYNIKNQTIESSISNDSVFQYDTDKIDYIIYNKDKYAVLNNDDLKGLYLEICNTNKIKIYKGYSVTVVTGSLNPLTQEKISEDTYEQISQYYFSNNGKYEKFKPTKKEIFKLLNDKSVEIKEYLSKHTIEFSNDQDLKVLFNYYCSL